jgi:hyperosmotically inducible protein
MRAGAWHEKCSHGEQVGIKPARSEDQENVMKKIPALLVAALMSIGVCGTLALSACSTTQSAKTQVDDTEITTAVKADFVKDDDVKARDIDVTTNEGVVTLTGRVHSADESAKAERIARGVNGVKNVRNLLKVGDLTPPSK